MSENVTSISGCDICDRECDPESVTHGQMYGCDVTACHECAGGAPMIQCAGGCGLWCDPEFGEYCVDHYWRVVETSMLPREAAECFRGVQSDDGCWLALWNEPSGTTRSLPVGPQPAWFYESEAA